MMLRPAMEMTAAAPGRDRAETRAGIGSYPQLDWLRFVLASVVALGHGGVIGWPLSGYLAVQVFLALSGWLIGSILTDTGRDGLPRFFFNRATRIWIPYAIAVALLYGVSALREPVDAKWLEFLAYDVTFTHNLYSLKPDATSALAEMPLGGTGNHFWSIAVEEQFYLLAPLLILFLPSGKSLLLWIPLAVAMVATASWFGAISLGVAAAIARRDFGDWHLPFRAPFALAAAVLFAGFFLPGVPERTIAPVFAILVVLALATEGPRGRLGLVFGGLSYSLYLNHWIPVFAVHFVLNRAGIASSNGWEVLAYLLAVAGAAAHYQLIDLRIQRHRAAWFTVVRGEALRTTGYLLLVAGLVLGLSIWGLPYWG